MTHTTAETVSDADRAYMRLAAHVAARSHGDVSPNPMVGAVLVKDGKVIGVGRHKRFGGLHAEREALANCAARGNDPAGATAYVTLEPCRHTGKQPPCTEALLEAGISRVLYAREDPGHESGGGASVLGASGIPCELLPGVPEAEAVSSDFCKRIETGLPWVIAKWAQTIDGRIATRTGESQWISGPNARRRVHRLRSRVDAILTGLGTVLADDPMLNARDTRRVRRVARRIVIDSDLDTPMESNLVRTAREYPTTIVCAKENLHLRIAKRRREALTAAGVEVLGVLGGTMTAGWMDLRAALELVTERHQIQNVLVESGPGLLGSLLEEGLIDEALVYVAPVLLGDEQAKSAAIGRVAASLSSGVRLDLVRHKRVGEDVELTYRRREAR